MGLRQHAAALATQAPAELLQGRWRDWLSNGPITHSPEHGGSQIDCPQLADYLLGSVGMQAGS